LKIRLEKIAIVFRNPEYLWLILIRPLLDAENLGF
jgi:hypothetical protein